MGIKRRRACGSVGSGSNTVMLIEGLCFPVLGIGQDRDGCDLPRGGERTSQCVQEELAAATSYRYFGELGLAAFRMVAVAEVSGVIAGVPCARNARQESFFPRQQSTATAMVDDTGPVGQTLLPPARALLSTPLDSTPPLLTVVCRVVPLERI